MNLLSNLWTLLGVAGAALGGMVLAYFRGRRAGKNEASVSALQDTINEVRKYKDAADDNDSMSADQLRDRLRERGAVNN
jgi:hypothetical protein